MTAAEPMAQWLMSPENADVVMWGLIALIAVMTIASEEHPIRLPETFGQVAIWSFVMCLLGIPLPQAIALSTPVIPMVRQNKGLTARIEEFERTQREEQESQRNKEENDTKDRGFRQ